MRAGRFREQGAGARCRNHRRLAGTDQSPAARCWRAYGEGEWKASVGLDRDGVSSEQPECRPLLFLRGGAPREPEGSMARTRCDSGADGKREFALALFPILTPANRRVVRKPLMNGDFVRGRRRAAEMARAGNISLRSVGVTTTRFRLVSNGHFKLIREHQGLQRQRHVVITKRKKFDHDNTRPALEVLPAC